MKVAARSLSVRVAAAMVLLVAVMSLVIGALTTAAIGSYLTRQLDGKVAATQAARSVRSRTAARRRTPRTGRTRAR